MTPDLADAGVKVSVSAAGVSGSPHEITVTLNLDVAFEQHLYLPLV
jgi:hypothetical protein